MIPILNETYYAWIAPDGEVQIATIAIDPVMCLAFTRLLHKAKMGQSPHEMKLKGFSIQPVNLTIKPVQS